MRGGTTEETVWAGWQAAEVYRDGQLHQRRTWGLQLDEAVRLETDLDGDGTLETTQLPVYDSIGNLVAVTTPAGKPVERYRYTPFGQRRVFVDSTPPEIEQVRVVGSEIWLEVSEAVSAPALADALTTGALTLVETATSTPLDLVADQPVTEGRQSGRRVVVAPTATPAAGTEVVLTVAPDSLVDEFFNRPAAPFVQTFSWPAADAVIFDDEAPGLRHVLVRNGFLEIQLSEEPDLAAAAAAIQVDGSAVAWTLGSDRYTLVSADPLPAGSHDLTIGTGGLDLAGQGLDSAFSTTIGAQAVSSTSFVFREPDPREVESSAVGNGIGFHGLEADAAVGLVYVRNRWLDPELGRFITTDPQGYVDGPNLYQYALNSPVNFSDPNGLDAIAIAFVDYRIAVGDRRLPYLGHAAVVTLEEINRSKAMTQYFEYGRYDAARLGEAHNRSPIPNVDLGPNGLPTKESLKTLLQAIAENYGQSSRIEAAYFVTDEDSTSKMTDYAWQCVKRNEDPKREPYSTWSNNCGTFVEDVIEAGEENLPIVLDPRPNARVFAWQSKADFSIEYDPETGKLDVPEGFFTANKTEILRWKALPLWKRVFTEKPH